MDEIINLLEAAKYVRNETIISGPNAVLIDSLVDDITRYRKQYATAVADSETLLSLDEYDKDRYERLRSRANRYFDRVMEYGIRLQLFLIGYLTDRPFLREKVAHLIKEYK